MSKKYVEVNINISEIGTITPKSIKYNDTLYPIDRLLDTKLCANLKIGGIGTRYTILVGGHTTYLWEERGKWWVEEK